MLWCLMNAREGWSTRSIISSGRQEPERGLTEIPVRRSFFVSIVRFNGRMCSWISRAHVKYSNEILLIKY